MSLFDVTGSLMTMVSHADKTIRYPEPPGPGFEFSGEFCVLGETTDELQTMLGIRGQLSKDIEVNFSHLFNADTFSSPTLCPDSGSHPTVPFLDLIDMSIGGSASLNQDIGKGVRDVVHHPDWQTRSHVALTNEYIPEPGDGSKSFLIGGVMSPTSWHTAQGGGAWMFSQYDAPSSTGWIMRLTSSGGFTRIKFLIQENAGGQMNSEVATPYTAPWPSSFAFLCVYEAAIDKLKIMTSVPESYAEIAIDSTTTFFQSQINNITVGMISPIFASFVDGFEGDWSQVFSFQWSGSLDSEISEANMTRWLQYMDGALTL